MIEIKLAHERVQVFYDKIKKLLTFMFNGYMVNYTGN